MPARGRLLPLEYLKRRKQCLSYSLGKSFSVEHHGLLPILDSTTYWQQQWIAQGIYQKMHHVLLRKSMHVGVQTLPWLSGQGMMYLTGLVGIARSATQKKASEKIVFLTNLD